MDTKQQDFLSWYLNPIMANNYGQNGFQNTYLVDSENGIHISQTTKFKHKFNILK
jgi:hypothetical protein